MWAAGQNAEKPILSATKLVYHFRPIMVQRLLWSLDDLVKSKFGRPFPRHGLQLLFWFAKDCVTCELVKCVVVMKLVSDCHPERGCFGFHLFGNVEELLPALERPRKRKKKIAYYEVGNLNPETYPASNDLPTYVTQNYGFDGDFNTDRVIISYQVKSRVVESIYVTKHDSAGSGSFSPDDTYEVSSELIQALQSPHVDLSSFLTQMGFYQDIPVVLWCDEYEIHDEGEEMFDMFDTFSGFNEFFQETFNQKFFDKPFSHGKKVQRNVNVMSHHSGTMTNYNYSDDYKHNYSDVYNFNYSDVQHDYRRPKERKKPRDVWQHNLPSGLERPYNAKGFDDKDRKKGGGWGVSLVKILLGAGALLLAVRCFSWLRSCSQ
ncbi:uncharacterized protein LOC121508522 [Cheilinus undulatus]|uniref:uncharacterized protein LOC121508522 n=1 Tax=Cheilinus undulatus TaxID=241271 RepID=UPI001BD50E1C|nr:uncharacterized protein LOC121508522 [Cheilinus undulatus]